MVMADRPSDPRGNVAAVVRAAEELLREHRPIEELQTTKLERLAGYFLELTPLIPYRWFRYGKEAECAISRLEQLLSYIESGGRVGQQWREQARSCALALLDLYYLDAVAHLTRVANKDYSLRLKRFDEQCFHSGGWEAKSLASEKTPLPHPAIDRTLVVVSVMDKLNITPTGWSVAHSPAAQNGNQSVLLLELNTELVEVARWKR